MRTLGKRDQEREKEKEAYLYDKQRMTVILTEKRDRTHTVGDLFATNAKMCLLFL